MEERVAYIVPGQTADQDPIGALVANATSVASRFEMLLDERKFPKKGRSADDRESYEQWFEDNHQAIQTLRAAIDQVRAERDEA